MRQLRAVAPAPWQLAADADAPHLVFIEIDSVLPLATSTLGLGLERRGTDYLLRMSRSDLERLAAELEQRGSRIATLLWRYLRPMKAWKLRSRALEMGTPYIMGIVNLTGDSFSGDGVGPDIDRALERAAQLRDTGATIIDVGAESARADRPVAESEQEAELIGRAVGALVAEGHIVSADTYKAVVAAAALNAGAEIINDISGLTLGTGAAEEAMKAGAGYVLNYSYSAPKKRPAEPPAYSDVVAETNEWFGARLEELEGLGLTREAIVIDPGIAFGKSHDEDLQVLRRLGEFGVHGQPLLLAHSRKNYIGSVTGVEPAVRDLETHLTTVLALAMGASVLRVHDVGGTRRALALAAAFFEADSGAFGPDGESWPWRAGADANHMTRGEPEGPAPAGQRW
ncbi:MAG: dihydropteroate synthase [Dehalococcoidia bacterium]|nr:dihydropteroate synthase [Dehalococcoidia bacterium]MCA9844246.1 dihydropteroate synthase [Dehalococcoidia bacterium]